MTKPFVYEIRYLPGTQKDYLLERVTAAGDRQGLSYEPDDANWMALLSRQSSFRLCKSGSLSLYLERSAVRTLHTVGTSPIGVPTARLMASRSKPILVRIWPLRSLRRWPLMSRGCFKREVGPLSRGAPLLLLFGENPRT